MENKPDNMRYWDQLRKPPKSALKRIKGGRLGAAKMTSIDSQWRFKAMTEVFGPVGEGWYYKTDETWTKDGPSGMIMIFVRVSVFYRLGNGEWSMPVEGVGGNVLVADEKGGLRGDDEATKKATTDALGTALKLLGVGADIYAGCFDGDKYTREDPPALPQPPPEVPKDELEEARARLDEITLYEEATDFFKSLSEAIRENLMADTVWWDAFRTKF